MDRTKIDWANSTWNPVTGCLHGCKYCYARGIANRFGAGWKATVGSLPELDSMVYGKKFDTDSKWSVLSSDTKPEPYPYNFTPTFHRYRLNDYVNKKARNVFVCSMADLFGEWVPDEWIEEVFKACEKAPQHNYLFLTKNPQRYVELEQSGKLLDRENMWYGASVTNIKQLEGTVDCFENLDCTIKNFLSIEPILEDITGNKFWDSCWKGKYVDWIIIGAETGRRKDKVVPNRNWIKHIVDDCKEWIPVFMKSSLVEIWGEPLIQEFPEQLIIK